MNNKKILLMSGGLDSLIGWFYLGKPKPIYCKMGHKYEDKELKCIKNLQRIIPDLLIKPLNNLQLGQYEIGRAHV